jgi:gluconokinase
MSYPVGVGGKEKPFEAVGGGQAPAPLPCPMILIVMGVSGSGKTTIGSMLARALGWCFRDADDLHPESNIRKMQSGIALSDDDRWVWLQRLRRILEDGTRRGECSVLACSALKESYRRILANGGLPVRFVYLRGSPCILKSRLRARQGHFMPPKLLDSQLATLEEPSDAIVADVTPPPQEIVNTILRALGLASFSSETGSG